MPERRKLSHHLSQIKMGKVERKYVSVNMKYLRTCYNRALRRSARVTIDNRLADMSDTNSRHAL